MEVPGFQILSTLGSGAFGTVFLAVQSGLDRQVALKVLGTENSERPDLKRFRREAQVMAAMRHPGIVRLYAYQDDPKRPYLVMEYLPGGTLRDRIQKHPQGLGVEAVTRMAADLLGALAELHASSVLHRDVKPANILYRASGEAVLGDLGLVGIEDMGNTKLTRPRIALGTVAYMAPETIATGEMRPAGDLFAAGATLFEALTGVHPTGMRAAVAGTRIADPGALRPDAPRSLCDLIQALVEMDPAKRVGSAAAALKLLRGGVPSRARSPRGGLARPADAAATPRPAAPAAPPASPSVAVATFAFAFAAGIYVYGLTRPPPPPALQVRAGARTLTVVARPAAPDRICCVFDQEVAVASVQGATAGDQTTFQVAGLAPGRPYRAQLLATGATRHTPVDLAFRTAAEVELLGLEATGAASGVWLRTTPRTQVRWAGDREWVPAGDQPVRLAGKPQELEVRVEGGEPARVAVTAPRLEDDAPLDLGLMVGGEPLREQVQAPAGTRTLMEWLAEHRIAWVVLPPHPDGKPRLGQDLGGLPKAPQRMLSMRLPAAAERDAGLAAVVAAARRGAVTLALDAEWMYTVGLSAQSDEELTRELRAWREALTGTTVQLLVPAPLGIIYLQVRTELSQWLRGLGKLDSISVETLSDNSSWEADRAKLLRGLEAAGVKPDVRFVFALAAIRTEYLQTAGDHNPRATTDSLGLARCFVFARAAHPTATVIADLSEIAGAPPVRRPAPTWERLFTIARALQGTRFRKMLGGAASPPPNVDVKSPMTGLAFSGAVRAVQVLCTESRPVRARFTPARPGILRVPGPAKEPWRPRIVPDAAPLELEVTSAPLLYEELVKLEATAPAGGRVEVVCR